MNKRIIILSSIGLMGLSSCGVLPSISSTVSVKNEAFSISFSNAYWSENLTVTKPSNNELAMKIYEPATIRIYIPDEKWKPNQDNFNLVNLTYDEEAFDLVYVSSVDYYKYIVYYLYAMNKFDKQTFKVAYEGTTYSIDVSSGDYDFSRTGKCDSALMESTYPAFGEMINSIQYHEYTSPYPGISSYGGSDYWKEYSYSYSFENEEYDLGYLDYLKDSVYYPSKMDLGLPNIGYREASMTFNDQKIIEENTEKSLMAGFEVGYAVCDPGCTGPTNPLWSIGFQAVPLHYETTSVLTKRTIEQNLHNSYYLLKDVYPDRYSDYVVGDLTVKVIRIGDNLVGFFSDDNYAYLLDCYYNFN